MVFSFPDRSSKQSGLQVAFLGFVAPGELTTANSKFRLLGVRWRKTSEELDMAALLRSGRRTTREVPRDPYSENRAKALNALAQAERKEQPR